MRRLLCLTPLLLLGVAGCSLNDPVGVRAEDQQALEIERPDVEVKVDANGEESYGVSRTFKIESEEERLKREWSERLRKNR